MDARQAFKAAFLARCVHDNVGPDDALRRVKLQQEKVAVAMDVLRGITSLAGKGVDAVSRLGSTALGWGIPLAIAAPPTAGAIAGYGIAKAQDIDDTDVDELKRQELIRELRLRADSLERHREARQHRLATLGSSRAML